MSPVVGRILALAGKEVAHIRRDPRTAILALGMPVILLVVFGYGVSFDLDRVRVAWVDQDDSHASRVVAERAFSSRDLVRLDGYLAERPQEAFRAGARAVVVAPVGFGDASARGHGQLQVMVNASDGNMGRQTLAKLEGALRAAVAADAPAPSVLTGSKAPSGLTGSKAPSGLTGSQAPSVLTGSDAPSVLTGSLAPSGRARVQVRTLFNPESRSALFLVPGLAAYVVAIICVLLTALTVAREWELGSMEQLFATPVGRFEIVVGKLLPYLGLGLGAVTLVLSAGALVFQVPFRGSAAAVVLGSLLFVLGMLAQGLLISIVAKSQMVATQAAALSSMLPSMLLSGFLFPIENMPLVLQYITAVVPARYYIQVLRGALLRGNSLLDLTGALIALAAFSAVLIAISTLRFQRRLA